MKRSMLLLVATLIVNSCRQGTEVGNGVRTEPQTDPSSTEPSTLPETGASKETHGASTLPHPLDFLTSTCASPMAEPMVGRFTNAAYPEAIVVSPVGDSGGKQLVYGSLSYLIQPAPTTEGPFAIEVTPSVASARCGAVSTLVLSDGKLLRSVALDPSRSLSWTVQDGQVIAFGIQNTPFEPRYEFQLPASTAVP